uniref:Uncharacterized protein n=1 Tax=Arundo donax TaxID=35708 RepID=A0A0A9QCC0_ARUDO
MHSFFCIFYRIKELFFCTSLYIYLFSNYYYVFC